MYSKAIGIGFHTKPPPTLGSLPAGLKQKCISQQIDTSYLLLALTFTLLAVAGKCPKVNKKGWPWTSFQSRCYYHPEPVKKSLSDAIDTCAKVGGRLAQHFSTHNQREFLIYHAFSSPFQFKPVFTGITNPGFVHYLDRGAYPLKLCGSNASLLYNGDSLADKPDCSAPNLFTCEVNKGKSWYDLC